MDSNPAPGQVPLGLQSRAGERRKHARFGMRFPVFLRALGDSWSFSQTADVSVTGAFIVADRPYLQNTPIEYVLTFPPDLTKALQPLRVRFYASVIRCERISGGEEAFGLAVRNMAHRYLTRDEAASFDTMEQDLHSSAGASTQSPNPETGA